MTIQEPVQAAIWHCLNHYDNKDAVFLAERLCCEVETNETVYILATSYYRSNLIHQAYWLLCEKSRRSSECRFLQAKCAYELKKYSEAEAALTSNGFGDMKLCLREIERDFGEISCFALQLIAQICMKTERWSMAAIALRRVLKLNPFMWQAFVDLCNLGEFPDASNIFKMTNTDIFNTCQAKEHMCPTVLYSGATKSNSSAGDYITPENKEFVTTLNNPCMFNLATPNNSNKENLKRSVRMLRSKTTCFGGSIGQKLRYASKMMLDDTPVKYAGNSESTAIEVASALSSTRLKYLAAMSPTLPSFGVLPFISPCAVASSVLETVGDAGPPHTSRHVTNLPMPLTLAKVSQDQRVLANKIKGQIATLINPPGRTSTQSGGSKPASATQTCSTTSRGPSNSGAFPRKTNIPTAATRRNAQKLNQSSLSAKEKNQSSNIFHKQTQSHTPPRIPATRTGRSGLNNAPPDEKSNSNRTVSEKPPPLKDAEKTQMKPAAATAVGSSQSGSKAHLNRSLYNAQATAHHLWALKTQSAEGLLALLRDIGEAYKLSAHFQCKLAIKQLQGTLPKHHLSSSWVQSLIGVCHYELREYENAVDIFKYIHEKDPYRLDYMAIYSSSLWHLQKEISLSALAQDFVHQDKTSPVTWCIAGNCFSLSKEHDTAIKFFKRAIQLDPDFVYGYILLGHELILNEELDKAMAFFRSALVRDPRHYNAWFGIGTIYSKQDKHDLAELHYIKALKFNPQNSVILVHIGAMQFFNQKMEQALQTLNTAATLDPKNPLARYHRGSVYFSLKRYEEALEELEQLKHILPKEAVVFNLMGKIHKALGNVDLALMHFSWALDLDPKGVHNEIKDAFDFMSQPFRPSLETIAERSDGFLQNHPGIYEYEY